MQKKAITVGLTGGIASGKTFISNEFKKLGAKIVDSDIISRKVVEKGSTTLKKIEENFGKIILNPDLTLNRQKLKNIIFNDPSKRKILENITHPEIIKRKNKIIEKIKTDGFTGVIIVSAALLIESCNYKSMDKLIVVSTDLEIQTQRLIKRDQTTEKEALNIISNQMPLSAKITYANYVIDNNKTFENTKKQVEFIYNELNS